MTPRAAGTECETRSIFAKPFRTTVARCGGHDAPVAVESRNSFRNASNFRCCRCHQLRYRSQRMTLDARWENRANRIARRLGGEADDRIVYKPKWMRWATFNRMMDDVRS
jgi:hypothetical protein